VDADVLDARFDELLIGFVGYLLVVHPPGVTAAFLVGVVADSIALHRVRPQRQRGIEAIEPMRLAGGEDRMGEQALGADFGADPAGLVVDLLPRCRHLLVGEKPVANDI
jgi:hypothetical protein